MIAQDLIFADPIRRPAEHVTDCDPQTPDAGVPAALSGFDGNSRNVGFAHRSATVPITASMT
jgi:hypothetical protein